MVIQGIKYPSDFEAKKAMIETGRRMDQKGYVIAGDGSMSVRVGPNAVWITRHGADKGALTQDSFVRVDMSGRQQLNAHPVQLPEDLPIHLKVYTENTAQRSILHAYPASVVLLAACGRGLDAAAYTPAVRALGAVPTVPSGSADASANAVALLCKQNIGVILQNDGCMLWGESTDAAFRKLEALEFCARLGGRSGCCANCGAKPACCGTPECRTSCHTCGTMPAGDPPHAPAQPVPAEQPRAQINGLTPIVRPGEVGGFRPPQPKPAAPASVQTTPQPQPAPVPVSAVQAAPTAAAAPAKVTDVPREQVMAEVVRRAMGL